MLVNNKPKVCQRHRVEGDVHLMPLWSSLYQGMCHELGDLQMCAKTLASVSVVVMEGAVPVETF